MIKEDGVRGKHKLKEGHCLDMCLHLRGGIWKRKEPGCVTKENNLLAGAPPVLMKKFQKIAMQRKFLKVSLLI